MDSTLFETLGRELAPEQVTQRLRQAIATGVLRPGERLNQADLAGRLGVSRMPVREALRRLEAEGLVTMQPYKGATVAGISVVELQEIYEMRMALEALALRRSLSNMDDTHLAAMEALLRSMDHETDADTWLRSNVQFHDLLYVRADRPLLLETIQILRVKSDRFLRLFAAMRDRTAHAQEEHWAIFHALRQGDGGAACRLLQGHLQSTVTSLSEALRADKDERTSTEPAATPVDEKEF